MLKLSLTLLGSLSLFAACGSSSPQPAQPAAAASPEPGAAPAAPPANEGSCYVTKVADQEGCWSSQEEACAAAACTAGACICTEATSNNSCSCQGS